MGKPCFRIIQTHFARKRGNVGDVAAKEEVRTAARFWGCRGSSAETSGACDARRYATAVNLHFASFKSEFSFPLGENLAPDTIPGSPVKRSKVASQRLKMQN